MPRFVAVVLLALSVAACATQPQPQPDVATDVGRTTSENVGNTLGTSSTWGAIYGAPGVR